MMTGPLKSLERNKVATKKLNRWPMIANSNVHGDRPEGLGEPPKLRRIAIATVLLACVTGVCAGEFGRSPEHTSGSSFQDCEVCPEMVVVPAGTFTMGSSWEETDREHIPRLYAANEKPPHEVEISQSFALGRYEVTLGQYSAFVEETGRTDNFYCRIYDEPGVYFVTTPGRSWRDPGFEQEDDYPVVCVSWYDAKAYADWIARKTGRSYRLPTEAEWEYAARAGTETARYWGETADVRTCEYANAGDLDAGDGPYSWGDVDGPVTYDLDGGDRLVQCRDGYVFTAPVGSYKPNAFGLHDMLGNVWEWVEDCDHQGYEGVPNDGSALIVDGYDCGGSGFRTNRGASWSHFPWGIRAALRNVNEADSRFYTMGFRLAMSLPGKDLSESGGDRED